MHRKDELLNIIVCRGGAGVNVMDYHLRDWGSYPGQGKSHIRYPLNNILFLSYETSAELVLYSTLLKHNYIVMCQHLMNECVLQ